MKTKIPARDEIWFRKIYLNLIQDRKVTTIFRPHKRLCDDHKGFCDGESLKIKIVDKVGADWANVIGQTLPDFEQEVQVTGIVAVPLGSLTAKDFNGSTPDVFDKQSLIYHLGLLYNLSPVELPMNLL